MPNEGSQVLQCVVPRLLEEIETSQPSTVLSNSSATVKSIFQLLTHQYIDQHNIRRRIQHQRKLPVRRSSRGLTLAMILRTS